MDQSGPGDADDAGMRRAGREALAQALQLARADTLHTFAGYERALTGGVLQVPLHEQLNPPLWELGHVGWFQEYWIARNPQRLHGHRADPAAPRRASLRADSDALYHSGQVAHDRRWSLALPDADATRADLAAQLQRTLELLHDSPADDRGLYFHRLALAHEDMHHEAALYMAQALGIDAGGPHWQPSPPPARGPVTELSLPAQRWRTGRLDDGAGFSFDNECAPHEVDLPALHIDARVRRWADVLPFIEAGGYAQEHWWSDAGRAWLRERGRPQAPRYLRRHQGRWEQQRGARWLPLDPEAAASHLCQHEAEAWCAWAGRALPTEAQWERAAMTQPQAFVWGEVWEWTASVFAPYPGFAPHPYRDYSQPWFGSRRVLRGAAWSTQTRMRHPRYRNYFTPERNDIVAGLRSCRPA